METCILSFLKKAEWYLKDAMLTLRVRARWGTAWPSEIVPHKGASALAIDPHDKRARKKLVFDTLRNRLPRNRKFWLRAIEELGPQVALDVGVNYGECLFTPRYSMETFVHGFEANPDLSVFLRKSCAAHPDRERIILHEGIVSNTHGGKSSFFIDTEWSGSSTAANALVPDDRRYREVSLPVISIDGVLSEAGYPSDTVVFKIDVEGYESRVLEGMKNTLSNARWCIGFVEIDAASVAAAGVDLEQYWKDLNDDFQVYAFDRSEVAVSMRNRTVADLAELARKKRIGSQHKPLHTDLILVSGTPDKTVTAFLKKWTQPAGT